MPQGLLVFPRISPACSDAVVVVVAVVAAAAVAVAVGVVVVVALVAVMVMCDWWCCFCASCNHLTTQLFFFHAFRSQTSSNRLCFLCFPKHSEKFTVNTNVFGSELWMSMRFNEVCVLGGGECLGSRCDVASRWCLSCLCFLQLMLSREFFMGTAQMVVAIPLCFGCFASPIFVILDIGCFDFASRVAHPLILYIYIIYIYIYIIYILYYIYIY